MNTYKISRKQAEPIIKASFPTYRGRKIQVEFTDRVTFYNTNWSGGTRSQYVALKADGRQAMLHAPAPWVNAAEGRTVELLPGVVVVKHTICCGEDCGLHIYAHPTFAPKWLTA